jgi:hypothetical protein
VISQELESPLFCAAGFGKLSVLKWLVEEHKADPRRVGKVCNRLLYCCSWLAALHRLWFARAIFLSSERPSVI